MSASDPCTLLTCTCTRSGSCRSVTRGSVGVGACSTVVYLEAGRIKATVFDSDLGGQRRRVSGSGACCVCYLCLGRAFSIYVSIYLGPGRRCSSGVGRAASLAPDIDPGFPAILKKGKVASEATGAVGCGATKPGRFQSTSWPDDGTSTGAVMAIFWLAAGGVTSTGAVIAIASLAPFCSFWALPNTPM